MTKLIFRSGLRTIGGTIVEVINEDKRIVFDFGTVFSPGNPEKMPNVEGIFDNSSKYDDIVLMSHIHLDHSKAMNLIHQDIPLIMNEQSAEFIEDLYKLDFQDFLGEKRNYQGIKAEEPFYHGNFKITNILVDHDVLGAGCFLIETADLTLLYTGDLRIHGLHNERTFAMLDYIKDKKIDVAIFEGVGVSFLEDDYKIIPSKVVPELQMEKNYSKLIASEVKEEGILINPYIMGIERLYSTLKLAQEQGKEIWLTNKFAYLANKYYPEFDFKVLESDKFNLGKEVVNYKDIDKNVIAIFDYNERDKYPVFTEKVALLQTGGEPLGDFDPRWLDLQDYAAKHNLEVYKIGAGGHAFAENLIYLVEAVNPEILIPLHSFKPELVNSPKVRQLLVEENKEYIFNNHYLED